MCHSLLDYSDVQLKCSHILSNSVLSVACTMHISGLYVQCELSHAAEPGAINAMCAWHAHPMQLPLIAVHCSSA